MLLASSDQLRNGGNVKIQKLITELERVYEKHGDIQVTCTGCLAPETYPEDMGAPFETTVENLVVSTNETFGKKVRLYL